MRPLKEIQVEDNPSLHHPGDVSSCIFNFIFSFKIQEEDGKKRRCVSQETHAWTKGQVNAARNPGTSLLKPLFLCRHVPLHLYVLRYDLESSK